MSLSTGHSINRIGNRWIVLAGMVIIFAACNQTRSVPEGKYLLNKAEIKADKKTIVGDLKPILKQKPNRKILGISRFYLNVYTIADRGKETKFKKWLKKTIGEPPVIFDEILTKKSSIQLGIYLQNIGYFNATVSDTVVFKRKKANVVYTVKTATPYKINDISYLIQDSTIRRIVTFDAPFREFNKADQYNSNTFGKERDRITKLLNDSGYYRFNSGYIRFWADTALKNKTTNLKIEIENPQITEADTSPLALHHRKYYINNIYINSTYRMINLDSTYVEDPINFKDY